MAMLNNQMVYNETFPAGISMISESIHGFSEFFQW